MFCQLVPRTMSESADFLVLPEWIEHSTSPLPRGCLPLMLQENFVLVVIFPRFSHAQDNDVIASESVRLQQISLG
jgi:hypothetical protein